VSAAVTASGGGGRVDPQRSPPGLVSFGRLVAARVHGHHDPQVEEGGDDGGDHAAMAR
jgi:hypothetical protein